MYIWGLQDSAYGSAWEENQEGDKIMKILLIDDEFEVRETLKSMLNDVGVDAIYASDAVSALLHLKDHGDIKVVITDYRLPGLGGKDWVDLLKHYHPTVDIVVISGYDTAINNLEGEEVKTLKKPFDKHQLLEAIGI